MGGYAKSGSRRPPALDVVINDNNDTKGLCATLY